MNFDASSLISSDFAKIGFNPKWKKEKSSLAFFIILSNWNYEELYLVKNIKAKI